MAEDLARMIPEQHKDFVEKVLAEHHVPKLTDDDEKPVGLLGWTHEGARPQVDISLSHPISLLVNALGPPPKDIIDLAHAHDVKVAALVGSVQQAQRQVNQGVDIIVAQGHEAGGHTGDVASMVLVPEVVDAIAPVPVLAAGGIGSGRQMAAAMALGADGVWTGSIWLTVAESDMTPIVVEKLLHASSRDTVRSRCLSGKPARATPHGLDRRVGPGGLPRHATHAASVHVDRGRPTPHRQGSDRGAHGHPRRPNRGHDAQRAPGEGRHLRDGGGVRRRQRAARQAVVGRLINETKFAKAPDGAHLAYRVVGEGAIDVIELPATLMSLDAVADQHRW